ncbi:hypothetical protein [Caldovatus aquaticus]|uniref:ABC transporter ATP-binding protein n=1 Tax=Caldovatus aquaticus TaxID=2865671 RepID=A0ABS7F624_9PROT|nr:hypothetical protein [Caldovatus aquaticus]MBW8270261.1 hypothetical protein [Caldovatus aquaticus]
MRQKDWRPGSPAPAARARTRYPGTAIRLLLFGEQAARWLIAAVLVAGTAALCAVALMGPQALALDQRHALPQMLGRLRDALAGVLG